MSITKRLGQTIIMLLASFTITSCSTYPNKFKCGDARGLGCTMLHEVDKQIDSGQIEEAYQDKNKAKKCRGKTCSSKPTAEILKLKQKDQAVNVQDELEESLDDLDDNNLNLHF